MIPVIGIPYLNRPDLLQRCLASIDHPVDTVILIDNSNGGWCDDTEEWIRHETTGIVRRVSISEHENTGVAASWNEVIKLFPAPWWLLVNNEKGATAPSPRGLSARTGRGVTMGSHQLGSTATR